MTTEQLIEKMRSELYDTHFCKQDFEKYDAARIAECREPFLWEVYENGTCLAMVGPTAILSWLETETLRMQLFRDFYAPISVIPCHHPSKDSKLFYFDGFSFMPIKHKKVHELYDNLWANTIRKEFDNRPEEAEMASAPLKLMFSDGALQRKLECEKKQRELGNDSFTKCLQRLERWTRLAIDHEIRIGLDFYDLSFTFGEYVNGNLRINGGIIFHGDKWCIHT